MIITMDTTRDVAEVDRDVLQALLSRFVGGVTPETPRSPAPE